MPADPAPRDGLADGLRGLALVGVLIVNAVGYAEFPDTLHIVPPPVPADSPAAWTVQALLIALLQGKAYPLLAFLFGWSFGESFRRRGPDAPLHRRRRLRRLLLLGVLHGALVYAGDVLTAYALAGFLLLPMARWRMARLLRWWWALVALAAASAALQAGLLHLLAVAARSDPSLLDASTGYGTVATLAEHAGITWPTYLWTQLLLTPVMLPVLMGLMVAGLMVSRMHGFAHRRWQPVWRHHARWALSLGLVLNVGVTWEMLSTRTAHATGAVPSLGSAALLLVGPLLSFGVLAWLVAHRPGWLRALAPAGRRSLGVYLAGSLVFLLVYGGSGLGLGPRLGSVGTLVVALLVATALVGGATASVHAGRAGVLERWMSR